MYGNHILIASQIQFQSHVNRLQEIMNPLKQLQLAYFKTRTKAYPFAVTLELPAII